MSYWKFDEELKMDVRRSVRNQGKVVDYRPYYYENWTPARHKPKSPPRATRTVLMRDRRTFVNTSLRQTDEDSRNTEPCTAQRGVKRSSKDSNRHSGDQGMRVANKRQPKKEKADVKRSLDEGRSSVATRSRKKSASSKPKHRVQGPGAGGTSPAVLPRGGVRGPLSHIGVRREEGDSNLISSERSSLLGLPLDYPAVRKNRYRPATPRHETSSSDTEGFEDVDDNGLDIFADNEEAAPQRSILVRDQRARRYEPINGPPDDGSYGSGNVQKYNSPSRTRNSASSRFVNTIPGTPYPHKSVPAGQAQVERLPFEELPGDTSNNGFSPDNPPNFDYPGITPHNQQTAQNWKEFTDRIVQLASGQDHQQERAEEMGQWVQSYLSQNGRNTSSTPRTHLARQSASQYDPDAPSTSRAHPPRQNQSAGSSQTPALAHRRVDQHPESEGDFSDESPKIRKRRRQK